MAEKPDLALRSPARWAFLALFGVICVAGIAMAFGGAFAPLGEGESRSAAAVLGGVQLGVLGAAGVVLMLAPSRRRPLPPARSSGDGAVLLPLRAAHRVSRVVLLLTVGSLGLTLFALTDSTAGKVFGVVMVLVGVAFAVVAARPTGEIRLDPAGVTLPPGVTPRVEVAWSGVVEVAVTGGWQPTLVMTWKGPGLSACRILSQAWPPSTLVAVIEHYRTHGDDRAALTDPAALDQFRH